MSLTPGARLGSYEITGLIGTGGMGEVYQARDTRLGRPAALKVMRPECAGDAQGTRRFLREAASARIEAWRTQSSNERAQRI